MKIRIAKYLASCGISSRRKSEKLIGDGQVSVNGVVILSPALDIDPSIDAIKVSGKKVSPKKKVYYLLNKPVGYTSTTADEHAKKLITELVPDDIFVWPVGRLDRETSGLMILTNDGDLTQKLTHPKYEKSKKYVAKIDKPLENMEITKLIQGIELEDGYIKPDHFVSVDKNTYEITIHEGRNRLVRRIFEHFGKQVVSLVRVGLSFLEVEDLKIGQFRNLSKQEIERLKNA